MELYWSPEPELMVEVTDQKDIDKAQCYYHALDVEKLEAELAQVKADLVTAKERIVDLIGQYAFYNSNGEFCHEGLSVLEDAFSYLKIPNRCPEETLRRIPNEKEEGK